MMRLTPFCQKCGVANDPARTHCFACGQLLSLMQPGHRSSPSAKRRITRRSMLIGLGALTVAAGTVAGIWWKITPHPSYIYRGHSSGGVAGVAWSPDGKRIASASGDNTVQVWDATDGSHLFTYQGQGHLGGVTGVAWSPDSKRIASASSDRTIHVWNAADGDNIFIYQGPVNYMDGFDPPFLRVAWSPDGKRIASAAASSSPSSSNAVQVWEAVDGSHVFTYRGHSPHGVSDVAWSPADTRIASAGTDGTVQVWNASNGANPYIYKGHTDPRNVNNNGALPVSSGVNALAWSPNGTRIASAGTDGTVQVWNASNGGHVLIYRGHPIVSEDLFGDPGGYPTHVAWASDGKYIASTGTDMQVWGATDGVNVCTYSDAAGPIAWSPDSKHIVSASTSTDDYTVQVWDAP